jgi:hypothetical protein
MNVEIGTETPLLLFWEYLFLNFGILSLQCGMQDRYSRVTMPSPIPNSCGARGITTEETSVDVSLNI